MRRVVLVVGFASLLALALAATLSMLAACGSANSEVSTSPSRTATSAAATLPFAPPVTPSPGRPFVGYWAGAWGMNTVAIPIEVLPHGKGYEVSLDGGVAVPVPLVTGHLLVSRLGPSVAAQAELLWRYDRCVLSLRPGSYSARAYLSVLTREDRASNVKSVDGVADYETWQELLSLANSVQGWMLRRGQGPPARSQLRPDSAFARWARSLMPSWSWPRNPFTDRPMSEGTTPGDFTYTVKGRSWKLVGHQSDGGTWDALKGFPSTVPAESPSPGT